MLYKYLVLLYWVFYVIKSIILNILCFSFGILHLQSRTLFPQNRKYFVVLILNLIRDQNLLQVEVTNNGKL